MNKQSFLLAALFSLSAGICAAQPPVAQGVLQFHGSIVERTCGLSPQQTSRWPGTGEAAWSERCADRNGVRSVTFSTQDAAGANDLAVLRQRWPDGVVVLAYE